SEERLNDKLGDRDPDKDYGLPKVEITPFPTAESKNDPVVLPEEVVEEGELKPIALQASSDTEPVKEGVEDGKKPSYGWLVVLLLLIIFASGGWYYFTTQQVDKIVTNTETKPVAETPAQVVPEPEPEIIPEEKVEEYTLTEITSRGDRPRYFVVVGSFVDEDMAKDHSDALNAKGMNTFLIYPYGEIIYYRLAIGQYDTFALALEEINRVKDGYKENLWALKY